jgi:hypothetical protein
MTSATTRLDHSTTPLRQKPHHFIALFLFAWLCLIALLGYNEFFIPDTGQPPIMLLVSGVASLLLFTLAYRYSHFFRDYVLNLDMRLLVMLHGFRTLGMGFVMLYSIGKLPAIFALPAGFGDAIAAVWAIIIAYHWFTRPHGLKRKTLLRWNHFGLLDFMFALSLGVLSQTNGMLQFVDAPSSDLMVVFPFVLIPGFLVQVFFITHIIIYLQLRNNWKNQDTINLNPI